MPSHHGPEGLKNRPQNPSSDRDSRHRSDATGLYAATHVLLDTLTINTGDKTEVLYQQAQQAGMNLRLMPSSPGISCDETTSLDDIRALFKIFAIHTDPEALSDIIAQDELAAIPAACRRSSDYLTHAVFNMHHSETQMMRYLKRLENKDFSLTHGMIPLGSCYHETQCCFRDAPCNLGRVWAIHPFAPKAQAAGYAALAEDLKQKLCAITGYDAFSCSRTPGRPANMPDSSRFSVITRAGGRTPQCLPDPKLRPRHQPRIRIDGVNESSRSRM
ncbi:hypothetical protein P4S72_15750 [Vibrio sp. PP-XX7]